MRRRVVPAQMSAAQMSAEELAQASGDPADEETQETAEARAATVARVGADDPAVVTVNWFNAHPADAEIVARCGALEGNAHVRELNLRGNSKLTEAVLEAVSNSRLGTVDVRHPPAAQGLWCLLPHHRAQDSWLGDVHRHHRRERADEGTRCQQAHG